MSGDLSQEDSIIASPKQPERLPEWLRRAPGSGTTTREVKQLLRQVSLNTVCEEARCPNIGECFGRGTATFMILGDVCTRGCRFCSVHTGKPVFSADQFETEATQVALAARTLRLRHVVVTSVARDDLEDGGASGFVATIRALREQIQEVTVEVLVPDFRGNERSLEQVVEARPDVFNHNLETVPRLYRRVRPGARYVRSLELLKRVRELDGTVQTKTGIMLGLGEEFSEVNSLLEDVSKAGVQIFTAGQYMQPTKKHLPVERYLRTEEFQAIEQAARAQGIRHVASGPLVRSSYRAEAFVEPRQDGKMINAEEAKTNVAQN